MPTPLLLPTLIANLQSVLDSAAVPTKRQRRRRTEYEMLCDIIFSVAQTPGQTVTDLTVRLGGSGQSNQSRVKYLNHLGILQREWINAGKKKILSLACV